MKQASSDPHETLAAADLGRIHASWHSAGHEEEESVLPQCGSLFTLLICEECGAGYEEEESVLPQLGSLQTVCPGAGPPPGQAYTSPGC